MSDVHEGSDYWTEVNGRKVHFPSPPVKRKASFTWRPFVVLFVVPYVVGMAMLLWPEGAPDRVASALDHAVERTVGQESSGTLTGESLQATVDAARGSSGCGWVVVTLLPVPPTPAGGSTGGQASAPQDPLQQVRDYATKEFRPEAMEVQMTVDSQSIVLGMGYSCG